MARMHEASEETRRETRYGHRNRSERGAHNDSREVRGRDMGDGAGSRANSKPWNSGNDAAYIEPKLIPDYELLPRDDSGGPEWDPYTQQFGDGGYVTGEKAHLSARGGRDDEMENDEISSEPRERSAKRAEGEGSASPRRPSSSARMARE